MDIEKLKSGLLGAIEKYNGIQVSTGEIRIDNMARDCFNTIVDLEKQLTAMQQENAELKDNIAIQEQEIGKILAETSALKTERDAAVKDIMCRDHCDVCTSGKEVDGECKNADYDCLTCNSKTCRCRDCRDENKWVWRGIQQAKEEMGNEKRAAICRSPSPLVSNLRCNCSLNDFVILPFFLILILSLLTL